VHCVATVVVRKQLIFQSAVIRSNRSSCFIINWVLSVTKKKLKIAGFFASLPFQIYLCNKTKAINTLRSNIEKNSTDTAGVE